jgi:hypothetical protein
MNWYAPDAPLDALTAEYDPELSQLLMRDKTSLLAADAGVGAIAPTITTPAAMARHGYPALPIWLILLMTSSIVRWPTSLI